VIASVILAVLAVLLLVFLLRLAKGQSVPAGIAKNAAEHLRPVDVNAFRNLVDPEEREYLRQRLPQAEFRRIQRERVRAAIDYIASSAHNAAILIRVGEAARASADPATAEAAARLIADALSLRIYALRTIPRLYLEMMVPGTGGTPLGVADGYEQMTRLAVHLGLQHPLGKVSSAL